MKTYTQIPSDKVIRKTIEALKKNGIEAVAVQNRLQALNKVLEIIPKGSEVMTMTSVTLDEIKINEAINDSGNYISTKKRLLGMDRNTEHYEMQKIGAAAEWSIGSVHAVTQDGDVIVASNSGSQLPGYVYGSKFVLWVVGAQKLVKDIDKGIKRIYEHTLPLESARMKKVYGLPGSFVSKILIFHREPHPNRIKMIIVKENLGF